MADVGATAAPEDVQLRQRVPERGVLRGEIDRIAVVELLGFVELGERRVFFATVIDAVSADVDMKTVRRRVTERVLHELGDLPS